MTDDEVADSLDRAASVYRSTLDVERREALGERFFPDDTRLRQLALLELWLEKALQNVRAKRKRRMD